MMPRDLDLDLDLVPEPPASPAVMAARRRRALVAGLGGGREADLPMAPSPFAERRLRATDTVSTRGIDPLPGMGGRVPRGDGCDAGAPALASESLADAPPAIGADAATGAATRSAAGRASSTMQAAAPRSGGSDSPARPTGPAAQTVRAPPTTTPSTSATPHSPLATGAGLRLDDALVVPAGALLRGYLRCRALLLVGDIVGNVHCTAGPVVIRSGASLSGRLVATGDVYVCGTVGDSGGGAVITTRGKLTLAPGARVDGDVRSGWLDLYDGCVLNGSAKRCED